MPRIKPTETEERNRISRAVISEYCAARGYDTQAQGLAALCGFGERTARNRYKDPETIQIGEIRRLKDLTDEQVLCLVRGRKPEAKTINIYISGKKLREGLEG